MGENKKKQKNKQTLHHHRPPPDERLFITSSLTHHSYTHYTFPSSPSFIQSSPHLSVHLPHLTSTLTTITSPIHPIYITFIKPYSFTPHPISLYTPFTSSPPPPPSLLTCKNCEAAELTKTGFLIVMTQRWTKWMTRRLQATMNSWSWLLL